MQSLATTRTLSARGKRAILHTPVGLAAAIAAARVRADAHWVRRPDVRQRMTARFQAAADGAGLSISPSASARRCIEDRAMSDTLLHHPEAWPATSIPLEEMRRLMHLGRGLVLVSVHSPSMWIAGAVVASRLEGGVTLAVGDDSLDRTLQDRSLARGATVKGPGDSTLIRAADAYLVMRRRLGEGGAVCVLFDVPGRVEVQMLGKRTCIHPWFAKLARRHGSVILPSAGVWDGHRFSIQLGDPVLPSPEANVAEVCQRTAASIERLWRRRPHLWAPYTGKLWPDDARAYRWAFEDDVWDEMAVGAQSPNS